jgi:hypothetical protein
VDVPGLLDPQPINLDDAVRLLRELRARARHLVSLGLALAALGAALTVAARGRIGVPLLIGAAVSFALWGLCRTDRRRLLVRLVAQGDALALDGVRDIAERLRSPRERRRLASGLRAAAEAGTTGAQISMMVDPARASDVGDRLTALAEAFGDPVVQISAPAAAVCRRLLCDAMHSPLYNPHVPERDLRRVLDLLERELRPALTAERSR